MNFSNFRYLAAAIVIFFSTMAPAQKVLKGEKQDSLSIPLIPIINEGSTDLPTTSAHGGRNGGDGAEIEIEVIARKIFKFLGTTEAQEVEAFHKIDLNYLERILKVIDFSIVDEMQIDQFGNRRTCTNYFETMDIKCNRNDWLRIEDVEVKYILIFHELLGLLKLEIGHKHDPSQYSISGKLLPYINQVITQDVETPHLTPEYFLIKNKSYGLEILNKNKKSKKSRESIRLICFDNVDVYKCDNFTFVKKFKGSNSEYRQTPLLKGMPPLSRNMLYVLYHETQDNLGKRYLKKKLLKIFEISLDVINFENLRGTDLVGKSSKIKAEQYATVNSYLISKLQRIKSLCYDKSKKVSPDWCK